MEVFPSSVIFFNFSVFWSSRCTGLLLPSLDLHQDFYDNSEWDYFIDFFLCVCHWCIGKLLTFMHSFWILLLCWTHLSAVGIFMYRIVSSNKDTFDFFLSCGYALYLLLLSYFSSWDFKHCVEQERREWIPCLFPDFSTNALCFSSLSMILVMDL